MNISLWNEPPQIHLSCRLNTYTAVWDDLSYALKGSLSLKTVDLRIYNGIKTRLLPSRKKTKKKTQDNAVKLSNSLVSEKNMATNVCHMAKTCTVRFVSSCPVIYNIWQQSGLIQGLCLSLFKIKDRQMMLLHRHK